jgi:hypothetical protein
VAVDEDQFADGVAAEAELRGGLDAAGVFDPRGDRVSSQGCDCVFRSVASWVMVLLPFILSGAGTPAESNDLASNVGEGRPSQISSELLPQTMVHRRSSYILRLRGCAASLRINSKSQDKLITSFSTQS